MIIMHWNYLKRIFGSKYGARLRMSFVLSIGIGIGIQYGFKRKSERETSSFLLCIGRRCRSRSHYRCRYRCVEAFCASLFECISCDLFNTKQAGNAFWISKVAISFGKKWLILTYIRKRIKIYWRGSSSSGITSASKRNYVIAFQTFIAIIAFCLRHTNAVQHSAQSNK